MLYLFDEYYGTGSDLAGRVNAIKAHGSWIPGVMDPEGHGRRREDGLRMMQLYNNKGLQLVAASNNLESGILDVQQRMIGGRLKVFATLERYREDLREYRRDERGQIVTQGGNLAEAARCLVVRGLWRMRAEPRKQVKTPAELWYEQMSWSRAGDWMR